MPPVATLIEYKSYPYQVAPTDSFRDGRLFLTEKTLELLENLNRERKFLDIGRQTIKPAGYVGVVRVNTLTIQIFPKVFGHEDLPYHQEMVAGNLLKMLSYTGRNLITEADIAGLDLRRLDLFEVFIHLFAKSLLHTVRGIQRKEYVARSGEPGFVRGRIQFERYTNPARMHIVPCRYHEFSVDNLMNRTLKYTCHLMSRTVSDFATIRLLRSILDILDPVTFETISLADTDRITFTRLNRAFEPHIRFCRIFLANSSLTLQASKVESFSLLIPMEKLFEEFISAVLVADPAYFFGRQVAVRLQSGLGGLARDESGRQVFNMRPDILIGAPEVEAVIDTKYKRLNQDDARLGVSQADLYQMYAYATKTVARRCMLLYPEALLEQKKDFTLIVPSPGGIDAEVPLLIRTVRLSYDLNQQQGWDAFLAEVREAVRPLLGDCRLTAPLNPPHPVRAGRPEEPGPGSPEAQSGSIRGGICSQIRRL